MAGAGWWRSRPASQLPPGRAATGLPCRDTSKDPYRNRLADVYANGSLDWGDGKRPGRDCHCPGDDDGDGNGFSGPSLLGLGSSGRAARDAGPWGGLAKGPGSSTRQHRMPVRHTIGIRLPGSSQEVRRLSRGAGRRRAACCARGDSATSSAPPRQRRHERVLACDAERTPSR